jgi:hypothetical protein
MGSHAQTPAATKPPSLQPNPHLLDRIEFSEVVNCTNPKSQPWPIPWPTNRKLIPTWPASCKPGRRCPIQSAGRSWPSWRTPRNATGWPGSEPGTVDGKTSANEEQGARVDAEVAHRDAPPPENGESLCMGPESLPARMALHILAHVLWKNPSQLIAVRTVGCCDRPQSHFFRAGSEDRNKVASAPSIFACAFVEWRHVLDC